jgi:dTDP-4-amino-4,6-dideoxygalactose transaminase
MNIQFVDLKAQYESIKPEIDKAISDVISKTAFVGGTFLTSFEKAFAAFCNVKNCVGVGNGTDAIYIALKALGIGPGDEVITVANSFIATSEAITMTGAKVVFVDINPQTYNIDGTKIEGKVTSKTKAIVPVHLYGQPADMDRVLAVARSKGLKVVEDCAQAHGAMCRGRRVGCMGDIACFSFYPTKNLGAIGDGGMIVTNDGNLAKQCRLIREYGWTKRYVSHIPGWNSRLDELQAAVLRVNRFPKFHVPNMPSHWSRFR